MKIHSPSNGISTGHGRQLITSQAPQLQLQACSQVGMHISGLLSRRTSCSRGKYCTSAVTSAVTYCRLAIGEDSAPLYTSSE